MQLAELNRQEELWKDVNTRLFWVEALWVIGCVSSGFSGFISTIEHRLSIQLKKGMILIEYLIKGKLHGSKYPGVKTPSRSSPHHSRQNKELSHPKKKIDIRLITPSSKLAQPLADLQNSLPQPFKR